MMDFNTLDIDFHMKEFVDSRLASAGYHRYGPASPAVRLIGGLAMRMRRLSERLERWSTAPSDVPIDQHYIVGGPNQVTH